MTEKKMTDDERAREIEMYRAVTVRMEAESGKVRATTDERSRVDALVAEARKAETRERVASTDRGQGVMAFVFALCLIPLVYGGCHMHMREVCLHENNNPASCGVP